MIEHYEIELSTPECHRDSEIYKATVTIDADISEALPYVNATVEKAEFIPGIPVLVYTEDSRKYALRARELAVSGVTDRQEARHLVEALVKRINETWERRGEIEPSFESYERPRVLDILKLLPVSNCGECGLPSCMAFADALSKGKKRVEECPTLRSPESAARLEELRELGL